MPAYLSPGVYIEEVDSGARPIGAVGTSTAGFVGTAPDAGAKLDEAVSITSWSQFVATYAANLNDPAEGNDLANAVHGFFLNGGSRCFVVNCKAGAALLGGGKGLDLLAAVDEVAIIAAPGRTDAQSYADLIAAAELNKDRIAILDGPAKTPDTSLLTEVAQVGAEPAAAPAAAEAPPKAKSKAGLRPPTSDGGYGAFYFPWLIARDALKPDPKRTVSVPPSGHLAGIYARTDAQRGVHKAPANTTIRGALGLTQQVTQAEQAELNPKGVNCIRFFTQEGIRVWGARTLAPESSNWKYVNVRRLFNMIEESIGDATRWVVFEPNDRPLWAAIRRDVSAFLSLLWRQGALAGAKPEEAFFVKCDEETNPPEVIDAGQVVVLIGIAPVKPAEFVIFRIGQSSEATTFEAA